jgi:hypothetical protein
MILDPAVVSTMEYTPVLQTMARSTATGFITAAVPMLLITATILPKAAGQASSCIAILITSVFIAM